MTDDRVSRTKFDREKLAREQAEKILEEKSAELYLAQKRLISQKDQLAALVEEKTSELSEALLSAQAAIIELQKKEHELSTSEHKFRSFVENANDIVFTLNISGTFEYLSPRLTDLLGYHPQDLAGRHYSTVIHPEDLRRYEDFFERLIKTGNTDSSLEYRVLHVNGDWRWHDTNAAPIYDRDRNLIGMLGIGRDIQDRKLLQEKLNWLAHYDTLTKISNRASILKRLRMEVEAAKIQNSKFSTMFIDLDKFKQINDEHGHATGDKILSKIAERLILALQNHTDAIGRLAGDEFFVILPNVGNHSDVMQVANRLHDHVATPINIDGTTFRVRCSIGIAIYPHDAQSEEALIARADSAMYHHKFYKSGHAALFNEISEGMT